MDYAAAMDLCQTTTENAGDSKWGVISATFTNADGAGAPQADQIGLLIGARRAPFGSFSLVRRFPVDVHEQRFQLLRETNVIVRATQPPLVSEFVKSNATHGAIPLVQLCQLLASFPRLSVIA